jgi:hypothetical protein
VTDTRWQCRDCSALVYPYCELCPHCGGARDGAAEKREAAFSAINEVLSQSPEVTAEVSAAIMDDPMLRFHGTLAPVDWKARHAAIKAERDGK